MLAAIILTGDDDARRDMGDADGAFRLVDVLTTGTRRPVGVYLQIRGVDVDLDGIVDDRVNPDTGKASLPTSIRVERADTDKAMNAALGLQPAIGIRSGDVQRRGFDPGLLALALFHQLHFIAVLLGPAHVHAHQHFGPILRLCPAGAGVQLDITVVAVGLAGQQAFDFPALRLFCRGAQRCHGIGDHGRVVIGFRQFDQFQRIGDFGFQLAHGVHRAGDLVAFAHKLLSRRGIVPQRRVFGFVVQFVQTGFGDIPVKDASSAARPTA